MFRPYYNLNLGFCFIVNKFGQRSGKIFIEWEAKAYYAYCAYPLLYVYHRHSIVIWNLSELRIEQVFAAYRFSPIEESAFSKNYVMSFEETRKDFLIQ